mgnify:CR=1 FL=1
MTMRYGHIPGIDKPISRLAQGTIMVRSADLENSFRLLDDIFALGCTTFDTAHVYGRGDNERTVGQWVNTRGIRDRVVIIGKGAHHNEDRQRVTPFDITADIYDSLARFRFDYIDLYLLHRDDPSVAVGPIVEILNEHARAGRIHAFGGSNWTHERICEANHYAKENGLIPFVASSPQFSLAEQVREPWPNCVSISGPKGETARAWYRQSQMPLFTWSSLAGGFFSGRITRANKDTFTEGQERLCIQSYGSEENFERLERARILAQEKGITLPQIALAYVVNQPLNLFPLVGCLSSAEFKDNLAAMDIKLTSDEIAWLELKQNKR